MTTEEFCYWLKGFMDGCECLEKPESLVAEKLEKVFKRINLEKNPRMEIKDDK